MCFVFYSFKAGGYWICPPACPFIPKTRAEKFFDFDQNKFLNDYELGLLKTHQDQGWPLAKSKTQRQYDFNQDHLLGPYEEIQYKNRKREGAEFRGIIRK